MRIPLRRGFRGLSRLVRRAQCGGADDQVGRPCAVGRARAPRPTRGTSRWRSSRYRTAAHWVLGRPGVFLNTAGDINLLPRILDAADRFNGPPSEEAVASLVDNYALESLFPR